MISLIKLVFCLVLTYIIAAPLTSLISMDLTQTEWGNLWVYVIWFFGIGIWALYGCIVALLMSLLVVLRGK